MSVAPLPPEERTSLRKLLSSRQPGDAMAAYYALYHPSAKTRIWVHRAASGRMDGFLVSSQTGQDLFRPFLTIRAPNASSAAELLRTAFPSPQPAIVSIPEPLSVWVLPLLSLESSRRILVFRLNPAKLEPVINILVVRSTSPEGLARFEIRRGDRLLAAAGVNWQSPDWAEIFVRTDPSVRERGHGKSVCAALSRHLLGENRQILYAVEEGEEYSIRLAGSLGFEDTGERELLCAGSVRIDPQRER
jgi:hypothetical protein